MNPQGGGGPAAGDAQTLGELSRNLANVTTELRRLIERIDSLPETYVTKDVHELAVGGLKVDIQRIERENETLDRELESTKTSFADKLKDLERDRRTGNRWAVGLAATAIGLVLSATGIIFVALPLLLRVTAP